MRAIVDIGPMKTGSSARARYFQFAQQGGLLPPGVLYPIGDLWFGKNRHHAHLTNLAHAVARDHKRRTDRLEAQRSLDRVHSFAHEQYGSDATVVFVGETLSHHLATQWAWEEFESRFDSVTFILNARRQDTAISSLITQRVKLTTSPSWSLDLAENIAQNPRTLDFYDYAQQATRWEPSRGTSELRVIPIFERDSDPYRTVASFFSAAGLGTPQTIKKFEASIFNKSPSPHYMQALSVAKRRAARWDNVPFFSSMFRERVNTIRRNANRDSASGSWKLPLSDRRDVLRHFTDSNESLLSRCGADEVLGHEWQKWRELLAETVTQLEAATSPV